MRQRDVPKPPLPLLFDAFYTVDPALEGIGPNLNFIRRDALNPRVPNFKPQQISELARHIDGTLAGALAATVLRTLLNNPDALAALNHDAGNKAKGEVVALNRAVHYSVQLKGAGPKPRKLDVKKRIADMWDVDVKQIEDDNKKHGTAAASLVDGIVAEAAQLPAYATLVKALAALESDMKHRATQMPKRRREKI